MRIAYVTQTRFPTEKAHGRQIAEVCAALSALGHEVTLLMPTVYTQINESPFAYYGVPASFTVRCLPSFDALRSPLVPNALAFAVAMWSYRRLLQRELAANPADLLVQQLSTLSSEKRQVLRANLRERIEREHSLETLIQRLSGELSRSVGACGT